MSRDLSLVNGRGISVRLTTTAPLARTSKQPLRGFSALIETVAPGAAALTSVSTLAARLMKTPQDLQASISTIPAPADDATADGGAAFADGLAAAFGAAFALAAGFLTMDFFGAIVGGGDQVAGKRKWVVFFSMRLPALRAHCGTVAHTYVLP
jgi:hypothetical protein